MGLDEASQAKDAEIARLNGQCAALESALREQIGKNVEQAAGFQTANLEWQGTFSQMQGQIDAMAAGLDSLSQQLDVANQDIARKRDLLARLAEKGVS